MLVRALFSIAYIDAMEHDGRLDADEAWLEKLIACKALSLKEGLERAKAAAKRLKQAPGNRPTRPIQGQGEACNGHVTGMCNRRCVRV